MKARTRSNTAALVLVVCALIGATPAFAIQTFTVNSLLDEIDDNTNDGVCHTASGTCTLRAAVIQANRTTGAGATIVLPAGVYTLARPAGGADDDYSGDLDLLEPTGGGDPIISLEGAGPSSTIVDAEQIDRVFNVGVSRTARISGITIRNGFLATGDGGGIYNKGNLTLSNVTLISNHADFAGAIWNHSGTSLTILDSQILSNTASFGGAIYNAGPASISRSTIAFNHAAISGGGLYEVGRLVVVNSTIAGNAADFSGGGIEYTSLADANIYNSTIAYNMADQDQDFNGSGGGVDIEGGGGLFNIYNTVVAGNFVSNAPVADDCVGVVASHARNLFGVTDHCQVVTVSGSWDLLNSIDLLGVLQDNGGPTQTIALLAGSNAIDGAIPGIGCLDSTSPILTDQRGFPRDVGACDLGAFEYGAGDPNDGVFANGFDL